MSTPRTRPFPVRLALLAAAGTTLGLTAHASADLRVIAATELPAPDLNGTYGNDAFSLAIHDIDDEGRVLFSMPFNGALGQFAGKGLLVFDGVSVVQIARGGAQAPGLLPGDVFEGQDFTSSPRVASGFHGQFGADGSVYFTADLRTTDGVEIGGSTNQDNDYVLYRWDGSGTAPSDYTLLLREGVTAPAGNGVFELFQIEAVNTIPGGNEVGLWAFLRGTAGGNADNRAGLILRTTGSIDEFFRGAALDQEPGFGLTDSGLVVFRHATGNGVYASNSGAFPGPIPGTTTGRDADGDFLRALGVSVGQTPLGLVFFGAEHEDLVTGIPGTAIGTTIGARIGRVSRSDGASTSTVFDSNTPLANAADKMRFPDHVLADAAGRVIVHADLWDGTNGPSTGAGLILFENGAARLIARSGDLTPSGGLFANPGQGFPFLAGFGTNGRGQVVFRNEWFGGLYVGDGVEIVEPSPSGQFLEVAPGTERVVTGIAQFSTAFPIRASDADNRGAMMNRHGQIAYAASLGSDVAVVLYTPDLSWRGTAGDGQWDSPRNWTLSITPAAPHELTLATDAPTTVNGPAAPTTVRALTLGTGAAATRLDLRAGATLTVRESLTLAPNAALGFELAGPPATPGSSARIVVQGDVTLAGTVDLSKLSGGYIPSGGQTFTLITYTGALAGSFSTVLGGDWTITAANGAVTATFAGTPCRADFDGQNGVQVADIFAFLRAWFAQNPSADFDGQNGIQVADIFSFLRSWFAGC